ncbi:MAG: glycerophosphoryl diester phosphodiesterase membrane domain-containing protein [Holophagales bacterium]|nr:glycerophosphoryl diester phosphodiesterase membrane domain-containing protein [Holophagales bacterium]
MAETWKTTRPILVEALRDFPRSWRRLVAADVAWKAFAFALLTPGTILLLRVLLSRHSEDVIADAEIARTLLTTVPGILSLVVGVVVLAAIAGLEVTALMAIGFAGADGKRLRARQALLFAVTRAPRVLGLTGHMVVRLLAGLLPFGLAGSLVYLVLLRPHDINYYLSRRPAEFWVAALLVAALAAALFALLVRTAARWTFALPIVLFEDISPWRALGESRRRSEGDRGVILSALGAWAAVAALVLAAAAWFPETAGESLAPHFGGSLAGTLAFVFVVATITGFLALAAGVVNAILLSLVLARLYLAVGEPKSPRAPGEAVAAPQGSLVRHPRFLASVTAVSVLAVAALVFLAAVPARRLQAVAVIAHRGSSVTAPENSLAAFRLAADQKADYVELDVQESADGEVLVVHDSDLMKAAGDPMKIWQTEAARIRSVDIGSRVGAPFAAERVPTLVEALAVCKGRCKVVVELKQYGHDVRLEEKVVEIVEAAGMTDDCVFMSLDHGMVRKMKELRPGWRTGVLAAKSLGDLTRVGADFVAVEKKMVTHLFVRHAHRAGQEVYPWTVDDPAWMFTLMSRGVDGLITNRPDLARQVIARRAEMTEAERVLVALLVRLGARPEALASDEDLRP